MGGDCFRVGLPQGTGLAELRVRVARAQRVHLPLWVALAVSLVGADCCGYSGVTRTEGLHYVYLVTLQYH